MSTWLRILLVGVGGQGVLSAGRWLGDAAFAHGLEVATGQVHGLSQRGGSVSSSVVVGGARSPEIGAGMADVLVALEPMEAARAVAMVSSGTTALINTRPILPVSLQSCGAPYPPLESLLDPLGKVVGTMAAFDATALAAEAGSPRAVNVVMLGLLAGSGLLPFPEQVMLDVILQVGIGAFREVNRKAFELGVGAGTGTGSGTEGSDGFRTV